MLTILSFSYYIHNIQKVNIKTFEGIVFTINHKGFRSVINSNHNKIIARKSVFKNINFKGIISQKEINFYLNFK